jgi:hypothetical protein
LEATAVLTSNELLPLPSYRYVDYALGPWDWKQEQAGLCTRVGTDTEAAPSLYVYAEQSGGPTTNLVALEMWYKEADHYVVASTEGKADAAARGYKKLSTLGYVWNIYRPVCGLH